MRAPILPPRELSDEPIDFDAQARSRPVHKQTLAVACIVMYVHKTRPRILKLICNQIDTDDLDLVDWARETMRCT